MKTRSPRDTKLGQDGAAARARELQPGLDSLDFQQVWGGGAGGRRPELQSCKEGVVRPRDLTLSCRLRATGTPVLPGATGDLRGTFPLWLPSTAMSDSPLP